jgi:hypothetical protein
MKNEINDFTIVEGFSSWRIPHFTSTSYSNLMTPQSQATVVKVKPVRLSPEISFGLEYVQT